MKATDLMIGDWATFRDDPNIPIKIWGINEDGTAFAFIDKDRALDEIAIDDEIIGIPLTSEILEKNEIKLLEVGDNGAATPAKDRNRFEKWEIHTQWKDTYLWYDRQAKYWHLSNMGAARLHFVHDLQHALRLCGISKEIEL